MNISLIINHKISSWHFDIAKYWFYKKYYWRCYRKCRFVLNNIWVVRYLESLELFISVTFSHLSQIENAVALEISQEEENFCTIDMIKV